MPTYKANLSVKSLSELLEKVQKYRDKVEAVKADLPRRVAMRAYDLIQMNLLSVTDFDGNTEAFPRLGEVEPYHASAALDGKQAAYLEFGTGINGMSQPHPQAGQNGWAYNVGSKIRMLKDGQLGWVWYDFVGTPHFTHGIEAQRIVYNAARAIRESGDVVEIAREEMEKHG